MMIALVAALGIYLFSGSGDQATNTASGDPDEILVAYLQEALADEMLSSAESGDLTLYNSDASVADGLGQSYDETKF